MAPNRLSLIAYLTPVVGVSFMENMIAFFLLIYASDLLLLAPAAVGSAFAVSRVWDAVSDPLVGYAKDRFASCVSSKVWVLAAALPLSGAFLGLWWVPADLGSTARLVWLTAMLIVFFSALTAFEVPHLSWGTALTRGSSKRTLLFGLRSGLSILGVLLVAGSQIAISNDSSSGFGILNAVMIGTILFLLAIAILAAAAPADLDPVPRVKQSWRRALHELVRVRKVRALTTVLFFEACGFGFLTVMMVYEATYRMGDESLVSLLLAGAVVSMLMTIPLWIWCADRFGKARTWLATLLGRFIGFACLLAAPADSMGLIVVLMILIGASFGGGYMLAQSLGADLIDEAQATGSVRGGVYFSAWNFTSKLAYGFAAFVCGWALQLMDYRPNTDPTVSVIAGIHVLYAGAPALCYAIAVVLLLRSELTGYRFTASYRI